MEYVYRAVQRFVDAALIHDDSMFTPGRAIWTEPVLRDLHERFVEQPDESSDSFEVKFQRQLSGSPPATIQLAAELLFVYFLSSHQVSAQVKRELVELVLSWSETPATIPVELLPAFEDGVAKAGMSFNTRRPMLLWYLLDFVIAWKALEAAERDRLLREPWAFKAFVFSVPGLGAQTQQHALLHLVHPDTFEPITSQFRKRDIVQALRGRLEHAPDDVDRCLAAIREQLTPIHGVGFNFWDEGVRSLWAAGDEDTDREAVVGGDSEAPMSAEDVRRAVSQLLPDPELRRAVLEQMARAIRLADEVNPDSWIISLPQRGRSGMRLNVGSVWCIALNPSDITITYDPGTLNSQDRAALRELAPRKFARPALSYVAVPREQFGAWWARLDAANAEATRLAATSASAFRRNHVPAALEYLRSEVAGPLPLPPAPPLMVREHPVPPRSAAGLSDRGPAFSARAFEVLAGLHARPRRDYVREHGDELAREVMEPFRGLLREVATNLPARMKVALETETRLFSRFPKNDYGQGGAWDFYWGAFYVKGGSRVSGLQLFARIDHDSFTYGFAYGDHATESARQFGQRCAENATLLAEALSPRLEGRNVVLGPRPRVVNGAVEAAALAAAPDLATWLRNPVGPDMGARVVLLPAQIASKSAAQLATEIRETFEALFPLVQLMTEPDPPAALEAYVDVDEADVERRKTYPIEAVVADSGMDRGTLESWVAAIERKGQAIVYGPPGTGKTHMARLLAKHLVSGGDGKVEIVQFHPA